MIRRTICLALAIGAAGIVVHARAPQSTPVAEAYKLVWADEFDKDGPLDPQHWRFEQGFVRNQELQWYQPGNAWCEKGFLIIEARREKKPNPRYLAGSQAWQTNREFIEYTSSSANTRGTHGWLYGRFEMRAKINIQKGSWPAFWTLGTTGRWPAGGEVDIMEYYNNTLLANIAWAAAPPTTTQGARGSSRGGTQWNTGRTPMHNFPPDWAEKFHTWRMDWDENKIALFIDDQLLNEQELSKTLNRGVAGDNPFHRPMYLLVNQAIGGQGGDPTGTTFPIRYEIDYVRVYQTPAQIAATAATQAATPPAR